MQPFSDRLTDRQLEIVRLLKQGHSRIEVSDQLNITYATLRWHLCRIRIVMPNFQYPIYESPLTQREQEVALLISRGLTNTEISAQLQMRLATTKKHINRLFAKADVRDRVQLTVLTLMVENLMLLDETRMGQVAS